MNDKIEELTELRMAYFREVYPADTDFQALEGSPELDLIKDGPEPLTSSKTASW